MKAFFEAIQSLFDAILFGFLDQIREAELSNWWSANLVTWVFVIIGSIAMLYWFKEMKKYKKNNEDEQDTTAHSFL